jgi:hypothetical protein
MEITSSFKNSEKNSITQKDVQKFRNLTIESKLSPKVNHLCVLQGHCLQPDQVE